MASFPIAAQNTSQYQHTWLTHITSNTRTTRAQRAATQDPHSFTHQKKREREKRKRHLKRKNTINFRCCQFWRGKALIFLYCRVVHVISVFLSRTISSFFPLSLLLPSHYREWHVTFFCYHNASLVMPWVICRSYRYAPPYLVRTSFTLSPTFMDFSTHRTSFSPQGAETSIGSINHARLGVGDSKSWLGFVLLHGGSCLLCFQFFSYICSFVWQQ